MIGSVLMTALTIVLVLWCGALVIGATGAAIGAILDWWDKT
jgi:hypothetical protein